MNMKNFLISLFFTFSTCSFGQGSPQSKKITQKYFPDPDIEFTTPAFLKKKGFTDYQEMMTYLAKFEKEYPNEFTIEFIGESQKGKQVPLIRLRNNSRNRKVRVWIQGGLHGNEPAGTESIFHLIDEVLSRQINLLDQLDITLVPMANIDGYEKHDRYAANGLDLNRDQTKLMAKESIFLKQAFSDFAPHVALDLHEYRPFRKDFTGFGKFGITNSYDVMFLYTGNLNVASEIREFTRSHFVSNAKDKLVARGYSTHDYFSTNKVHGEVQFKQGSVNSRSSATSYALSNCISSLIEIRGVGIGKTSFRRRVYSGYLVSLAYLQSAFEKRSALFDLFSLSSSTTLDSVIIKSEASKMIQRLQMIDVQTTELISIDAITSNALSSTSVLARKIPKAYILLAEQSLILEKLKILGLEIEIFSSDKTLEVESYTVDAFTKEAFKYEGVFRQNISTITKTLNRTFVKGDFIIYMNQKNAGLAAEVLEPEAANSFISFGLIDTRTEQELPIYRCHEKKPFH